MPFQPVIPLGGYAGWRILDRTLERQQDAFNNSPDIQRDIEYFRDNAATLADDVSNLVTDRQLLTVALGAFGLGDEIDKRAFIRKILEEGTFDSKSFANRLNNPDYIEFATTFGYGNGGFLVTDSFIDNIVDRYQEQAFEAAVGNADTDQRLSLNFRREIPDVVGNSVSPDAAWFKVLGNIPLRTVLEKAFGLPAETSQLDVDQQKEIFERKAQSLYGDSSPVVFLDPDNIEDAIRRFHVRQEVERGPNASTPGFAALTILQSSTIGSIGGANLVLSNI